MLFALDWMDATWNRMVSWILGVTAGLSVDSISAAMISHWLILLGCLLSGGILCFYGFRYHKLVLGLVGGAFWGAFGFHIGRGISESSLSVPVVYTMLFLIGGFCVSYLLYFMIVFWGGWLFFVAILPLLSENLRDQRLWIAVIPAVLYAALYIKYKLVMSAVSGSLTLGLLALSFSRMAGIGVACVCIPGGIVVQHILRKRYDAWRERERQEELEKYPYGPGLAYGWTEPKTTGK